MNERNKSFLAVLLGIAVLGNIGCASTVYRVGASQAALDNYGIGKGDSVLVRYSNKDDPRSSSGFELVEVTNISRTEFSGIGENGNAVNVGYDEVFGFEVKGKSSAIKSDNAVLMGASKAIEGVAKIVPAAACIALAVNGVSCLGQ